MRMDTSMIFCEIDNCQWNEFDEHVGESFCTRDHIEINKNGICGIAKIIKEGENDTKP